MTKFYKKEERQYITLCCEGHANSDVKDKEGHDLVCAIVSTIMGVAFNGCSFYTKECNVIRYDKGCYEFMCRSNVETRAITNSALMGLREAARQYPEFILEKGE